MLLVEISSGSKGVIARRRCIASGGGPPHACYPQHVDRQVIRNVDFHVRLGEIVGIAGLMGAGRTEFAMSLFGRSWGRKITGRAMLHGREVDLSTVSRAIDAGLAYVTEDRKQLGLLLADDVRKNITLANLDSVAVGRVIDNLRA
jgi:putative multiple sugar transport system ATP-binding protein